MNYETLDAIADSYNPILAIFSLLLIAEKSSRQVGRVKTVLLRSVILIIFVCVVYSLMFLDNVYHLWPQWGLDYSTHLAVSLALILHLCLVTPKFIVLWVISLLLYVGLMIYQGYHSIFDIVSTGLVYVIVLAVIFCPLFFSEKIKNMLQRIYQ